MNANSNEYVSLVAQIKRFQLRLDPEERIEFWNALQTDYCVSCGNLNPDGNCQCFNDE